MPIVPGAEAGNPADPGDPRWAGRVRGPGDPPPPPSTLVGALEGEVDAADAIVLQGYSGRSTIVARALEFLDIAERNGGNRFNLRAYRNLIAPLAQLAQANILRIYLTPRLDRYVDFHRSCLLGWRYEASTARQDAITVWLRAVDDNRAPIPYRMIQETKIGPSYAAYLRGALLDDYLGQPSSQSSVWGSQAGPYAGGKWWSTAKCGE